MNKEFTYRWIFFFTGIMVLGLGVSLTIKGQRFGVGSWDVLHIGLFQQMGLSVGLWSIILGIIIITIASIGLKEFPKLGTFMNMIFVGLFIDFFNWIIPSPQTTSLELISLALGIILLGTGSGIYISANLGAGPRDSFMLLIVKKFKFSMRAARTLMEAFVVVVGYFLGGPVGVGTVVMAFGVGPVMQFAYAHSKRIIESLTVEKHVVDLPNGEKLPSNDKAI